MSAARAVRGLPKSLWLAELPARARAIVVGFETDAATAERLSALGLGVGASITALQSGSRPTVKVGESRIALGPDIAGMVRTLVVGEESPR